MKYVVHVKAHGVYSTDVLESNTEKKLLLCGVSCAVCQWFHTTLRSMFFLLFFSEIDFVFDIENDLTNHLCILRSR